MDILHSHSFTILLLSSCLSGGTMVAQIEVAQHGKRMAKVG